MESAATSIDGASPAQPGSDASSTAPNLARIPILYVILGVLLAISVVPMYFYSSRVEAINRERLQRDEMLLQNSVTRSLADDLSEHERSLRMMLTNLSSALQVASGGDIGQKNIEAPELRALLENFVSSSDEIPYATLLNSDAKGIFTGRIAPDAFLQRELQHAFDAARDGRAYTSQALQVEDDKSSRTVVLVSTPVSYGGHFLGMLGAVVDLQFLVRRLHEVEASGGGLIPYVVDAQ
ncbi:MAG: cache domain-containing protein, partial [Candidatus Sulfotelmatobacter sp.]